MSILDTASTFFTGISTEVYKWLAIIGIVLILLVADFFYAEHLANSANAARQLQQDVKQQQAQIAQQKVQTITDTTAVTALQSKLDGLTSQNQTLQAQIAALQSLTVVVPPTITLAQHQTTTGSTPAPVVAAGTCELSADFSNIYNESLK